jgi:filamentous hemagglutinin family protein
MTVHGPAGRRHGFGGVRHRNALLLATTALMPLSASLALANPLGGQVVGGTATISTPNASTVTVTQTSPSAIINWNTFNIGAGQTTQFIQPGASSVVLDRVTGGLGPSQIYGSISANGTVYLVNPNGILFGAGAQINTGSFLATTHDIANGDFMAGRYNFGIPGNPAASIVNQGSITAANGGFAALVAPGVRNSGTITATLGTVGLAAANGFTLDFYGDKLITLAVNDSIASQVTDLATGKPLSSLIANTGKLSANGGKVQLTAAAARTVVDSVINTSGVIEANSVGTRNGMIVLSAATGANKPAGAPTQTVKIAGKLSASGKSAGQTGGKIAATAENISLAGAKLDVSGAAGGGTVSIGGKGTAWTATTVTADWATTIDASALQNGTGGNVVLWADQLTAFAGLIKATGGAQGGNGGSVETSGGAVNFAGIQVNTSAPAGTTGTWLVDPTNLTVDATAAATINTNLATTNVTLQTYASSAPTPAGLGVTSSGNGDIIVTAPISWSSNKTLTLNAYNAIYVEAAVTLTNGILNLNAGNAIGVYSTVGISDAGTVNIAAATDPTYGNVQLFFGGGSVQFTGAPNSGQSLTINGNPYTLLYSMSGLQSINASSTSLSGNYALAMPLDASAVTSWTPIGTNGTGTILNSGNGFNGTFQGLGNTISNLTVNLPSNSYVGLFGYVGSSGMIANTGLVGGAVTGPHAGGLVGYNGGTISQSYATGAVNAGATGSSSGATGQPIGGLVGSNSGQIVGSYATGAVTGTGSNGVGGLVGYNSGAVVGSSAYGNVGGTADSWNMGGLVGTNASAGNVTGSYAAGTISASGYVWAGALVGLNQGTILGSGASGAVVGTSPANAAFGGLVGYNSGTVTNAYATGAVTIGGSGSASGGGLIGYNSGTVTNAYATGTVTATGGSTADVGGLVGDNYGTITQSYATGSVSGGEFNIGGLVGGNGGTVTQSYATGAVSGGQNSIAGGLIGYNWLAGKITQSYATGTVIGGVAVGGLAGLNDGSITQSYAAGTVSWAGTTGTAFGIGGLVGGNDGTIAQTYATGTVSGVATSGTATGTGGLVGSNFGGGTITQSYATGAVTGSTNVGGLVGSNTATITYSINSSYWDTTTDSHVSQGVGNGNASGVTGLTTAQFGTTLNFSGWNFGTTPGGPSYSPGCACWAIVDNDGSVNNASGAGATRPMLLSEWSTTVTNPHQLQLMALSLTANYTLANNINLGPALANPSDIWGPNGSAGFVPIGNSQNGFSGSLNGQGYAVDNLTINSSAAYVGLFGIIAGAGSVQNLGINNINLTAAGWNGASGDYAHIGALAGINNGTITASYATGSITSNSPYGTAPDTGGLVGTNTNTVKQSYAGVNVIDNSAGTDLYVGGLVGWNNAGTITQSYATGTVTNSASSSGNAVGGLAGYNNGTIAQAYATGAVNGTTHTGGLIGDNSGSVTQTYAIGAVTGASVSTTGGLVGVNDGTVGSSYWNTQTTGQSTSAGGTGLTTAQMQDLSSFQTTYAGWDFQNVWAPPNQTGQGGQSSANYPQLYALTPVVWNAANNATSTYGSVIPPLTATTYGGPGTYAFGSPGDTLNVFPSLSTTATPTSNVDSYAIVNSSPATATSADGVVYRVVNTNGTLTINPASPINYSVANASSTYGTVAAPGAVTLTGVQSGTTVTATVEVFSPSAPSTPITLSTHTPAGTYTEEVVALSNPNYTIASSGNVNGTLTIGPATLTYTANLATRTYGAADPALSGTVAGFVAGDTQASATTGTLAFTTIGNSTTNVGSYAINGGGLTASNYVFVQAPANATALSITPATLTYVANSVSNPYGAAIPTLTGSVAGFVNDQTLTSATTGTPIFTTTATPTSNVGSYPITGSGLTANHGNYVFVQAPGNATAFTIGQGFVTYSVANISSTYGTLATPGAAILTGAPSGVTATVEVFSPSAPSTPLTLSAHTPVGTYTEEVVALSNPNYTLASSGNVNGTLTINPATLTYTATSATRAYGAANPTLSGTVTGFVAGDTQTSATTGTLSFTTTANATSNVGSYAINGGGLTASNYVFVQAPANATALSITPATLTYVANSAPSTYGAAIPSLTGTVTGFVNGQSVATATTGTPSFTTTATPTSNVGSYAINGSGLTANNGNYVFVQAPGNATALTINPATLTYVANLTTSTYGAPIPPLSGNVTGFVNGQTIASATTGTLNFTTTATPSSNVGSYSITGGALTANHGNYVFTQASSNATALTITQAAVDVTYSVENISSTYGTLATPGMATLTGAPSTVTATVEVFKNATDSNPITLAANTPVGSYTEKVTALSNPNYTIASSGNTNGILTINPATLTFMATPASRTYGGANPTLAGNVTGFVNGESLASATAGTLNFTTAATVNSNVGSYAVTGGGLTAANYVFAQAPANASALTITPAPITVTALGGNSTYGGSPSNPGLTATGLQNGQTASVLTGLANSFGITNTTNAGSYTLNVAGTLTNPNYTLTPANTSTATWTVSPATLTYAANPASTTYGAATPALTGMVTGLVNGQTLASVTTGSLGFTTSATPTSNVGTYPVTGGGLSLTNGNYVFAQAPANSSALTIAPATLTITADPTSTTVGSSVPALTGTVTGFVNGQTLASVANGTLGFSTTATPGSNPGSYPVTGGGLVANNGNYIFVQAPTNFVALTITPPATPANYGLQQTAQFAPPPITTSNFSQPVFTLADLPTGGVTGGNGGGTGSNGNNGGNGANGNNGNGNNGGTGGAGSLANGRQGGNGAPPGVRLIDMPIIPLPPGTGLPPLGEARFSPNEIVLQFGPGATQQQIDAMAQRFGLTIVAMQPIGMLGRTVYTFRLANGQSVREAIQLIEAAAPQLGAAVQVQPNYSYGLTQADDETAGDPAQYVIEKFHLAEAHRITRGNNVIVAVIDSAIDVDHPDLAGVVTGKFDAGCGASAPDAHGTGMTGAIASHAHLLGVAPNAKIIAICAFGGDAGNESTSIKIINGLDHAIRQGARIVNMSFAGPRDPALSQALQVAREKGILLIGAAGNAGPKSPPLYPGADPSVLAVTAVDDHDRLFARANQGKYIAVAAPGVDVLVPAPNEGIQLTTGTSVATAHVSGVAALLIAQKPSRTPEEIRTILMSTAKDLGPKGVDSQFGAGLVDPLKALRLVPVVVGQKQAAATLAPAR